MKRILGFISVLTLIICIAAGCSTEKTDLLDAAENARLSLLQRYHEASVAAHNDVVDMYKLIGVCTSRSDFSTMNGNELFWYLVNLPSEEMDSLRTLYCTDENLEACEYIYELNLQALIDLSSPTDAQNYYSFIDSYVEIGGHNIDFIEKELKSTFANSSDELKFCIIDEAAYIDEFIPVNPNYVNHHEACLKNVIDKMVEGKKIDAGLLVATEIADIANPTVGLLVSTGGVIFNLIASLELAHEYNMCMLTTTH